MIAKIIRRFCLLTWKFWEFFGVHLVPNHFYFPILDSKSLKKYNFDQKFDTNGIEFNKSRMLDLLKKMEKYKFEYSNIHQENGYCSNGDGAILYSMIRILKPSKIIEVGSGYSTKVINHARIKNVQECSVNTEITCIEPYPKKVLLDLNINSDIKLIKSKVEDVDEDYFQSLNDGDILFIDTSHVVDIANDVHYLYLKIIPKIRAGVYIHIHDIRLPYEYPKEWILNQRKYWCEQYLLHMFLSFNSCYEVTFASNYIYNLYKKLMVSNLYGLSESSTGWPGSFWIRRKH